MDYESLFKAARKAGTALTDVEPERLGRILQHAARLLRGHTPALLEANARDIEAMPASSPMLDRLRLTPRTHRRHRLRHGGRFAPAFAAGRGTGALDAPQRHDHRQAPRTVRRGRHGLRSPPQCHGRHLRALRQDGQRLRPERGAATPTIPTRRSRRCCTKHSQPRASTKTPSRCSPRGTKPWGRC